MAACIKIMRGLYWESYGNITGILRALHGNILRGLCRIIPDSSGNLLGFYGRCIGITWAGLKIILASQKVGNPLPLCSLADDLILGSSPK